MDWLKILWEGIRPQILGHVSIPNRYYALCCIDFLPPNTLL